MRIKKWMISCLAFGLVAATALTGCDSTAKEEAGANKDTGKVQVYTSLFPLEDFAKKIGGEHVQVTNIVPPGTDSHDFELTARDMTNLSHADVFVYNGAGFETWIEKVSNMLDPAKTVVVDSSKNVELLPSTEADHHDHSEEKGKNEHDHDHEKEETKEEHEHGEYDPHIWLDPISAKQQARNIKDGLIKADPDHQADYEKNYETLAAQLDQLHREYEEMVKQAKRKEIVVSHAAFSYLTKRYGIEQIAISGISPADEPSPKELKEIINTVREHQIQHIFFETLVSAKVAEVVKNEVKAEALTLNPLEGLTKEEVAQGADYFSMMRQNKENLAKALGANK